ncbi:MAG TPA: sigma-70 family RNA polymerase sigma factor [Sedimentisphaerales bacterium]|nr:sigma-70 family RNA polymerase sigma factor [Sedimentisphaerales bacterium]
MRDLEDQILVQRALHADPESFGELCRRYYDSLVAAAHSILPDHHLAEDAAQEALAAACRDLAKLKKPERFGPWIGAICRNVAKDMLRQLRKQQEPVEARNGNEPDCRQDERETILDQALPQLPQHLREVIFLRFYNEMSYEQMAKVLGATEQMIDGRLRRAKKKIAAYLMRKGFGRQ